ncbi:hypothetical protein A9Q87_01360 [Flavobacteriales bacterium 34_180_T64]|nr:hypothetical protein A9Q87_01360 [Flavobacteriales bacterium 34_180_T64]
MNLNIALLGIISGIAVATSFFLASYFLFLKKKDRFKNNLLGLLFVAIGFRIAKSIAYFIFIDIISIGLAIGFLGLSTIGPLFYIYMRSTGTKETQFRKTDVLHFAIPFLGFFACLFTHLGPITTLYKSVTALLFVYLLVTVRIHLQNNYENTNLKLWNTNLFVVIGLIWMSFVSQHLTSEIINYAFGTGIASLAIYYIFIFALKSPVVFNTAKKTIPRAIIEKVKHAFESDKIYLTQAYTLTKFAENHNIPTYLVTESVKQLYGKRFPEAINHFRIKDIKSTLILNSENNSKIEALAYEVGFNTPSTFYAAFKKETNMSPKEFQKKHLVQV